MLQFLGGVCDLTAMKVFIFACLVALALAREKGERGVSSETVESLSNSEESITQISQQKFETAKHEETQRKDEIQDKIHPFFQSQPLVYPYAETIPYPVLPPAQPAMMLPSLQSEIMEVPEDKDNVIPKPKAMPVLKSPRVPDFDGQIPYFPGGETLYLTLPLLQSLIHQQPQPVPQSPVLPPQSLLPLAQPQILPSPPQMFFYPQRNMPVQALLLYQESLIEPTQESSPVAQQPAQVYNPVTV
ncbi:beta-casein isoform X1 [Dasypus novemcinctus]|uniref:beta-casein isoform X1 n=1 Tax=Dasypus novemcinctus TaxID=9361 RepID=UPI00265E2A14|nr:beta-casein isoform X1 [Dasypus novemcinctus]